MEDRRFLDALNTPGWEPLPVLAAARVRGEIQRICQPSSDVAEVSRVVVSPSHRGLGLSRLLIRTAVLSCLVLGRRRLLLECVPAHQEMYRKYGFKVVSGYGGRAVGLDQQAVAMRLDMQEHTSISDAVALGIMDMKMLENVKLNLRVPFGSRHLCMCGRFDCWERGVYGWRTKADCPLREFHS
jgi:hypothetical protein